jgi:tRNA (adenine-N(1)-)-methyltransferase non-catalytic subunit
MLLEAYNYVRLDKNYCNTQLTESWMREFQVPVFASGTHPSMMTSGSGGFLFTATKVTSEGVEIVKPTFQQKKQKNKR